MSQLWQGEMVGARSQWNCFLCHGNTQGESWGGFLYVARPKTFRLAAEMLLCRDCKRTCAVKGELYVPMPYFCLEPDSRAKEIALATIERSE